MWAGRWRSDCSPDGLAVRRLGEVAGRCRLEQGQGSHGCGPVEGQLEGDERTAGVAADVRVLQAQCVQ